MQHLKVASHSGTSHAAYLACLWRSLQWLIPQPILCEDDHAFAVTQLNPKTSILMQKCHSYTGNLNSETPGDSKNAFLHFGDVLVIQDLI